MKKLKNIFFRRYLDKTVTLLAVFITLVMFTPAGIAVYYKIEKAHLLSLQSIANLGAAMGEQVLTWHEETGVDVWDTEYQKIGYQEFKEEFCEPTAEITTTYYLQLAGGDRTRYHTAYDKNPCMTRHIKIMQNAFSKAGGIRIKYIELVDRNGYVPWHGIADALCTGDFDWDLVHQREKRKWSSTVLNLQKSGTVGNFITHTTDYGERQHLVVSRIFVKGKHWGWFILAYNKTEEDRETLLYIFSLFVLSTLVVGGVFNLFVVRLIDRLYTAHRVRDCW